MLHYLNILIYLTMAQYNLPQFSTSPTPEYQQQPIIKLPNYAEIYARNFAYGQQTVMDAFKPLRNEIEKIQIRKERERLEKKEDEERLLRKEENIAKEASNYQQLIFANITKEGAGDFEAEIENMLSKNVDGFAANERAYKIEQSISAEQYNKMRAFYYKEINDMKLSSQALKDSLDWDAANSSKYSRYNNPEFPGLIKSLREGDATLGRTKTGELAIIYKDALDNEASYLVKDLKNLRAEDNISLQLDFSGQDETNIGFLSFNQSETELNQFGITNPTETIARQADASNGVITETTVTKFMADQKDQAIKYIVNQSATLRNLMNPDTSFGGRYYLDNMLYADGLGETGADIKVNTLARKFFKSKGIEAPSAEEFEKVENLFETYNERYSDDPLQNEIKDFQDEQIKLNYAEKLWDTRFATKESEAEVRKIINQTITNQDQDNANKKLYADSIDAAIDLGNKIYQKASLGAKEGELIGYTDTIRQQLNNFFGLNGYSVEYIETKQIGAEGQIVEAATYKLPEDIFGKNKTIQISPNMNLDELHSLRNSLYGNWADNIDSNKIILGREDYRLNKDTDNASYYVETIQGIGGALVPKDAPSSTPTTSTLAAGGLTDNQKLVRRRRWINSEGGKKYKTKETAANFSAYSFPERETGGKVEDDIVKTKDFKNKYPDYPADIYGQENIFGRGEEVAAEQAAKKLSAENQKQKDKLFANQNKILEFIAALEAENGDLGSSVELQILDGMIPSGLKIPEKYSFLKNN